jgi:hypothetical protein
MIFERPFITFGLAQHPIPRSSATSRQAILEIAALQPVSFTLFSTKTSAALAVSLKASAHFVPSNAVTLLRCGGAGQGQRARVGDAVATTPVSGENNLITGGA